MKNSFVLFFMLLFMSCVTVDNNEVVVDNSFIYEHVHKFLPAAKIELNKGVWDVSCEVRFVDSGNVAKERSLCMISEIDTAPPKNGRLDDFESKVKDGMIECDTFPKRYEVSNKETLYCVVVHSVISDVKAKMVAYKLK